MEITSNGPLFRGWRFFNISCASSSAQEVCPIWTLTKTYSPDLYLVSALTDLSKYFLYRSYPISANAFVLIFKVLRRPKIFGFYNHDHIVIFSSLEISEAGLISAGDGDSLA